MQRRIFQKRREKLHKSSEKDKPSTIKSFPWFVLLRIFMFFFWKQSILQHLTVWALCEPSFDSVEGYVYRQFSSKYRDKRNQYLCFKIRFHVSYASTIMSQKEIRTVLPAYLSAGPHGLGTIANHSKHLKENPVKVFLITSKAIPMINDCEQVSAKCWYHSCYGNEPEKWNAYLK